MPRQRQPKLCTHKASGLAYVTDPRTGTEVYFGPAGTPEAAEGYAAFCRELETWWAGGTLSGHPGDTFGTPRRRAEPLTVAGLCSAFLDHAETYYRKGGRPTSEVGSFRQVIARLTARGGAMRPDAYGPKDLAALRDAMAADGMARGQVNAQVRRVCRIWKWAVAEELLPPERLVALRTVPPLKKGRGAREGRKVPPVGPDVVMATLPSLTPRLAALVLFQLHAGMRPGEAVCCRPCDVDRTRTPWEYRPCVYKTEHHEGAARVVYLGPNARAALAPWLDRCRRPTAWVWPSPARRGRHYARGSYARAVATAVRKANRGRKTEGLPPLPAWSPRNLRHTAATIIRSKYGLEGSQVSLGHQHMQVTEIYAEKNQELAREVAEALG